MNRKLNRAIELLRDGAALAIVNGGGELTFDEPGIKTLLSVPPGSIAGAFVADKVVGKAAAMMLARGGAIEVYAEVISRPALEILKARKIICLYGKLVTNILNRDRTGICPMELAVLCEDNFDKAYEILCKKTSLN